MTQRIGTRASVMVGKLNALDLLAADPYLGGAGVTRWWANGLAAPPNGIVPASMIAAVGSLRTRGGVQWTVMLFDPQNAWTTTGLGRLFDNGVALSTSATVRGGGPRPATHTLSVIASNRRGVNLEENFVTLPPPPGALSQKRGTWNVSYLFERDLHRNATDPRDHWGVFLKGALADGNPNVLQASVTAGVAGALAARPRDGFGVGYFYLGTSDDLERTFAPALTLRNTQGLEAWYRLQLRALAITPDVQLVHPAVGGRPVATIVGLRVGVAY